MPGAGGEPIATLAREVRADLEAWAGRYPIFDRARFPAVAITTAVHVPDLTHADRALLAVVPLWLFAFDDLVDGGGIGGPELAVLVANYQAIVRGVPGPPRPWGCRLPGSAGQLGQVLAELGQRLATYSSFTEPLAGYWRTSFALAVEGIVRDRLLSASLRPDGTHRPSGDSAAARLAPPTYQAWLETAQCSIGVHPYLAACFVMYGDLGIASRLPALARITDACGRAFRLANDLRTWEKEERERNFNSVAAVVAELERAAPGLTAPERRARARHYLERRLAVHVAETRALLAASPAPDGAVEAGIGRLVEFVVRFYAAHDYHTFQAK